MAAYVRYPWTSLGAALSDWLNAPASQMGTTREAGGREIHDYRYPRVYHNEMKCLI